MSAQFQGLTTATGAVRAVTTSPPVTAPYLRGMRVSNDNPPAVYVSVGGTVANHAAGVPVTNEGVVCLTAAAGDLNGPQGGLRLGVDGKLLASTTAPEVIHQGVGLLATGALCYLDTSANLIVNGNLSGGANSGPGFANANVPPTNWTFDPNRTANAEPTDTGGGVFSWRFNGSGLTGVRMYLNYALGTRNPALTVGAQYRFSVLTQNLLGTAHAALSANGQTNLSNVSIDGTIAGNATRRLSMLFTVAALGYSSEIRMGVGIGSGSSGQVILSLPRLELVG